MEVDEAAPERGEAPGNGDDAMATDEAPAPVSADAFLASDAWSTGCNSSGQLGVGHERTRLTPARVRGRRPWRCVALGDSHGAGVSADFQLYTWGAWQAQARILCLRLSHADRQRLFRF